MTVFERRKQSSKVRGAPVVVVGVELNPDAFLFSLPGRRTRPWVIFPSLLCVEAEEFLPEDGDGKLAFGDLPVRVGIEVGEELASVGFLSFPARLLRLRKAACEGGGGERVIGWFHRCFGCLLFEGDSVFWSGSEDRLPVTFHADHRPAAFGRFVEAASSCRHGESRS